MPVANMFMTRCLIVANQTLGSRALAKAVREKLWHGVDVSYVIAPRSAREQEAVDWTGGLFEGAPVFLSEEARAFHAQMDALRDANPPFDEILISTLPTAISRWMDAALTEKIRALTDTKMAIVYADEYPASVPSER